MACFPRRDPATWELVDCRGRVLEENPPVDDAYSNGVFLGEEGVEPLSSSSEPGAALAPRYPVSRRLLWRLGVSVLG